MSSLTHSITGALHGLQPPVSPCQNLYWKENQRVSILHRLIQHGLHLPQSGVEEAGNVRVRMSESSGSWMQCLRDNNLNVTSIYGIRVDGNYGITYFDLHLHVAQMRNRTKRALRDAYTTEIVAVFEQHRCLCLERGASIKLYKSSEGNDDKKVEAPVLPLRRTNQSS